MVSGESDMVLSHDSGGIVATSDFYSRNVVCSLHLVCVPEGCDEYLFELYLHPAILRGDVLLGRMDGVKWVIQHNPLYAYIYVMRQCVVYGQWPETMYLVQMVAWAFGMLAFGILIFKKYENDVVERL